MDSHDSIRRGMHRGKDSKASNKADHGILHGGRTEELIYRFKNQNISSAILPSRDFHTDLPYLQDRKTMGNNQTKILNASEKSPVRRKPSSSNSVSKNGDVSSAHLMFSSHSRTSLHGTTTIQDNANNNTVRNRRNSSDSGYNSNSSGKVCETGLTNVIQRVNLPGQSKQVITASAGRDSLPGRSTSRTSSDLGNTIAKSRSYVNDTSMSVSPLKSPKSGSEGLVGLQNLGNTCFMNSILQCLSHCSPLRDKLLAIGPLQHNQKSKMKGKLLSAFADLIKAMWLRNRPDTAVSPHSFKTQIQRFSPRFVGYEQQDSQEFLRFLLEGLNEDLNQAAGNTTRRSSTRISPDLSKLNEKDLSDYMWDQNKLRDNSLVTDLFCGQIKSTLTCTKCSRRSVTYDPFWDLSLSIPRHSYSSSSYSSSRFPASSVSLSDCLMLFTKEEVLDGDEKPKCERCKTRQKCQKQIKIHRFPRILVIHLKRFSGFGFRSKLQTDVDFPLNHLDMSKFASSSSDLSDRDSCVKYNLFAVSNHTGSTFGGHYTAYCKHPESKEWHSFNDSRVGALSSSSVRGSQAYVLFYERDDS